MVPNPLGTKSDFCIQIVIIVQELVRVEVASWAVILTSLLVSVDVKLY